mmetsp:Transcript_42130/g.111016  ORF Transcript_42130/g.111016 Transcript_42130/m.111016 type:complete len:232 (+) Transcript_42130:50-745(+)
MLLLERLLQLAPDVRSAMDVVALAVHSFMLEQGFVCVGAGIDPNTVKGTLHPDVFGCPDNSVGVVLLPPHWNTTDTYKFAYKHVRFVDRTFALKAVKMSHALIVHAGDTMRDEPLSSGFVIQLEDYVKSSLPLSECLLSLPPDLELDVAALQERFARQVVARLLRYTRGAASSPTASPDTGHLALEATPPGRVAEEVAKLQWPPGRPESPFANIAAIDPFSSIEPTQRMPA